jgi:hypothetical protein
MGIAAEIAAILAIDYTAVGHTLFGTAALPACIWMFALVFAAAMCALEEGRKALARRRHRQDRSPDHMPADDALRLFRHSTDTTAVVVDERLARALTRLPHDAREEQRELE